MSEKNRGRPPTFTDSERRYFLELIQIHGARRARDLSEIPVSLPTLLKLAREHGLELRRGRRPRAENNSIDSRQT